MLKLTTAAILALSLSLAPASAREFHSGHARGFNGHAGGFHNFNRHAAGGFHSGGWHGGGYGRYGRDMADMADMADTGAATEHGYHSQPEPLS